MAVPGFQIPGIRRATLNRRSVDSRAPIAELMAGCPKCGAITTQVLALAYRARMVTCPECLTAMPVNGAVLGALRKQAANALATIDRLS
jgi:hypothetical protein